MIINCGLPKAAIAAIAQQQKEDLLKQKEGRARALAVKAAADATASVKDAEDKMAKAVAPVGAGGVLLRDLDIGKLGMIKASIDDATRAASEAKAMAAKAVEARAACQNLTNGERADAQTTLRKLALTGHWARDCSGPGGGAEKATEGGGDKTTSNGKGPAKNALDGNCRNCGSSVTRLKRAGRQVQRNPLGWSRCQRQEREERQAS